MVADMFNQGLKYSMDALCNELANLLRGQPLFRPSGGAFQSQSQESSSVSLFIPRIRARPLAIGGQRSWAIRRPSLARRMTCDTLVSESLAAWPYTNGGRVSIYDTGEHLITGFSQQQSGDQSLTFTSQFGLVRVADLPLVNPNETRPPRGSRNRLCYARTIPSRYGPRASVRDAPTCVRGRHSDIDGQVDLFGRDNRHYFDDRTPSGVTPKRRSDRRGVRGEKIRAPEPPIGISPNPTVRLG